MPDDPSSALAAAALYTGLNAMILAWLSLSVSRLRVRERISLGDAGNPRLAQAVRGHANFAENAPTALILLFAAALMGAPAFVVHLLGLALTVGRALHAWQFLGPEGDMGWKRSAGALLTLLVIALGGLGVALHALTEL
ncbi:MAG: MAPEG family protein [Pseudomonadota bacterium]